MPYVAIQPYPPETQDAIEAAYRQAHRRLYNGFPWAAAICTQLERIASPIAGRCPAATDGVRLILSEHFAQLDEKEQAGVLAHEAEHILLGHVDRKPEDADYEQWNVAADLALNPILRADGWDLPGEPRTWPEMIAGATGHLYDPRYDGWNAERILRDLPEPPEPDDQDAAGDAESDDQAPASASGAESVDQDADQDENEAASGATTDDPTDAQGRTPTPDDEETADQETAGQTQADETDDAKEDQAPAAGKHAGLEAGQGGIIPPPPTMSADEHRRHVARVLGAAHLLAPSPSAEKTQRRSRSDWRKEVAAWLAPASGRTVDDWTRPSRRYGHLAPRCYLPTKLQPTRRRRVILYIDTSGSMVSGGRLGDAIASIRDAAAALDDTDLTIAAFGTSVHWIAEQPAPGAPIEPEISGGGTAFRPVFSHAAQTAPEGAAVIIHTDLYGEGDLSQDDHPGAAYRILWLTYGRTDAPFGDVLPC